MVGHHRPEHGLFTAAVAGAVLTGTVLMNAMVMGTVVIGTVVIGTASGCSRSPVQRAESLARSLGGRALFEGERLFRLELQRSRLRDGDLPNFVAWVPDLEEIDISATKVTDEGIKVLATMPRLRKVSMSALKITTAAVEHLATMPELTDLYLVATPLTDDAVTALAKLTHLRRLSVSGSKLTDEGVERLRQALPGTVIAAESMASGPRSGTTKLSQGGS